MKQLCPCGRHEFEYLYEDIEQEVMCPKCYRKFIIFAEMDDYGELDIEFIPINEKTNIA